MITLHTYGPYFGCPDGSPFVMKGEMLLKLAGLPYQSTTRGMGKAPKGKLPYINDDGSLIADSTLIRLHIEKKYGIDFDRGLTPRDRGVAWCIEKMLEDHLYWVMVYWRWVIDENFDRGPRNFFKRAPAIIRPLIISAVRKQVRKNLHAQGIDEEKTRMADRCIDALSDVLGNNRYLMGDSVCGADATAFAFIAAGLPDVFDSPLQKKLAATGNLVAYRDRMMKESFPGFVKQ
jgi:glutathione S-transferase